MKMFNYSAREPALALSLRLFDHGFIACVAKNQEFSDDNTLLKFNKVCSFNFIQIIFSNNNNH